MWYNALMTPGAQYAHLFGISRSWHFAVKGKLRKTCRNAEIKG